MTPKLIELSVYRSMEMLPLLVRYVTMTYFLCTNQLLCYTSNITV